LAFEITNMMPRLVPPDTFHLEAAQGWLELGNHVEAEAELNKITPRFRAHPAVLEVRWEICARAKKWDAALQIATALVRVAPDHPLGWVHRSFCLYELERTAEAHDKLPRATHKSPEDAIMRYNLACHECRLGRLEQARHWLQKAFEVGDPQRIKLMALDDPDLKPLWRDIGSA